MSILPYLVNELVKDAYDPLTRLYDQNFGLGLLNDDLVRRPAYAAAPSILTGYIRPHRHLHPEDSGFSTIANQKDQFKVSILKPRRKVYHYKPYY